MKNSTNNQRRKGPEKGYKVYPIKIRKRAIEELDSGEFNQSEIAAKYGVTNSTISNWRHQIQVHEGGVDPVEATLDMVLVANQIISGYLTKEEAIEEYGFTKPFRIRYWVDRVRKKNNDARSRGELPKVTFSGMINRSKSDNKAITALEDALESARLRILALETLIDVAERDLGVDIRKKPGTKQSKK